MFTTRALSKPVYTSHSSQSFKIQQQQGSWKRKGTGKAQKGKGVYEVGQSWSEEGEGCNLGEEEEEGLTLSKTIDELCVDEPPGLNQVSERADLRKVMKKNESLNLGNWNNHIQYFWIC